MSRYWCGDALRWLHLSAYERALLLGLDQDPAAVDAIHPAPSGF